MASYSMKPSGIPWIGEIPTGWDCRKMKTILSANDSGVWGNDPIGDGTDKIVIRSTEQTIDGKWCIAAPARRDLSSANCSKSRIMPGDLLITKSSGSELHIGKTTIADEYFAQHECYFSNFMQRIRSRDYSPRLLWYLFNSPIIRDQCVYLQNTTTGLANINAGIIENLYIPFPDQHEQRRIVTFLDAECSRIDAVIEKTRMSLEEYKELKQSLITETVTKGIRKDRFMKESGIEWAKSLPVDWHPVNPKALFAQRKDKAIPGERQLTASQQYGVVYQDEYMELTGSKVVTVEKDFDILKHVEAGDFVISMRSFQGGLEYSTKTGSISSAYVMLTPNLEKVYPRFFRWLLKSSVYIAALQSTSNMVRDGQAMRYSNFAQVRLYLVPLEEQKEIADFLDERCAAMDRLIEQKTRLITALETYKKSLIYEYVTGKKEVPA